MKYMGSKNRIAKYILPIMLKDRKEGQYWVEPFVGGANMIDKVDGNRIGADSNEYIIALWNNIKNGWIPPEFITKEKHKEIRLNKENYEKHITAWAGFACSYSGVWFGGFAGYYPESRRTKNGVLPSYQRESKNSVLKQLPNIKEVNFIHSSYSALEIPSNSIIYCDPPYENTSSYRAVCEFNHEEFWEWCRTMSSQGHKVFVSEYNAPDDFECIWEKELSSQLSANGKSGGNKISIEKLFTLKE